MSLSPPAGNTDYFQGDLGAPVVLVQYGDFECPYSGAAYGVIKEIKAEWKERLCYVFRFFPLADVHPHAQLAAQAAAAVGEQFWPMHDLLFEHQERLRERDLLEYARELGLDTSSFQATMHSSAATEHVMNSLSDGRANGVHGTPTFFVNGQFYDNREGLWNKDILLKALEHALAL